MPTPDTTTFVPLSDADQLTYPCLASAFLDAFATGEGRMMGIIVKYAESAAALRSIVAGQWHEYYARDVLVRPWQGVPEQWEHLISPSVAALIDEYRQAPMLFEFQTTLYFNRS